VTVPKPVYQDDLKRLRFDVAPGDLELRRLIAKHQGLLKRVSSEMAAGSRLVLGAAAFKLRKYEEALEHYRIALQVMHWSEMLQCGYGAALLALERPREALDHLLAHIDVATTPGSRATFYANVAEAFFLLGDRDGAREAWDAAVACASEDREPSTQLAMATQAAELGLDAVALQYFALYRDMRGGEPQSGPELSNDERAILRQLPTRRLYVLLLKREQIAAAGIKSTAAADARPSRDGNGALAVAGEFANLRSRANASVLSK
jgi:tetratricopeptide (TPR) repeat protein